MNNIDSYLNLTDNEIENLLFNIDIKENNTPKKNVCNYCQTSDFEEIDSRLVCKNCGAVVREILNSNAQFESAEDGSSSYGRASSHFYPESSLGCKVRAKGFSKIANLQRQGNMPYKEKSLLNVAEKSIQEKCVKYGITQNIIDTAKILYKKISECKHNSGKRKGKNIIIRCTNRVSLIAACVYYACKFENKPRNTQDIADIYNLEVKNVNRGCSKFLKYVDITSYLNKIKACQASNFISRYSIQLFEYNLTTDILESAQQMCENIHILDIASNHEPPSVAAACVRLVCEYLNIDISKKTISKIFGISDVTISKTYRRIFPYYKIIMDNDVTQFITNKVANYERNDAPLDLSNIIVPSEELIKKKPIKGKKVRKKKIKMTVEL